VPIASRVQKTRGPQNVKKSHVTLTTHTLALRLAMINRCTKFEVPSLTAQKNRPPKILKMRFFVVGPIVIGSLNVTGIGAVR